MRLIDGDKLYDQAEMCIETTDAFQKLIMEQTTIEAFPKSELQDIKGEIEQNLSWFCFDDWGNESSTWTEIKKIIDNHMGGEDNKCQVQ